MYRHLARKDFFRLVVRSARSLTLDSQVGDLGDTTKFLSKHFNVSVAFQAKPRKEMQLRPDQTKFPHPAGLKGSVSGEDAFFIDYKNEELVCGVFDGVGGWIDEGFDPSRASWLLANKVHEAIQDGFDGDFTKVLSRAVQDCEAVALKQAIFGSTTVCLAHYQPETSQLNLFNIGDSKAVVVRNGMPILQTETQCYSFNAPYQIALPFKFMIDNGAKTLVQHGSFYSTTLDSADVVLLATDGLWDNLRVEEAAAVSRALCKRSVDVLTEKLVKLAVRASNSGEPSPFSRSAKEHGFDYIGGKTDDITLICFRSKGSVLDRSVDLDALYNYQSPKVANKDD